MNQLQKRQKQDPHNPTEKKQLELQVTALGVAPNGIMITDHNGTIIWVNQAFTTMTGYSVEESVGQNPRMLKSDKHESLFYQDLWKTILTGHVWNGEIINRRKDDTLYTAEMTITPVCDAKGEVTHFIATKQDITERKQAEEVLKQRAAHMALINDIGSKIAAMLELDSVLDRVTHLVQTMFNYHHVALFLIEGKELILKALAGSYEPYFPVGHTQRLDNGINGWVATYGQTVMANDVNLEPRYTFFITEHSVTRAELCLPIKVASQIVGVLDIQSPHKDIFTENDVMAMETLTNQIAVAIENARLYETMQQELSERWQAQEELQASEERFRQAVSSISDHIYITEVTADGRNLNRYISPNVEDLIGYPREKFMTDWSFWTSVIHPDDKKIAAEQMERLVGSRNCETEYRIIQANGNVIWIRDSGRVEFAKGTQIIYGVVSDITERKQMESALVEERTSLARRVEERTAELSTTNAELARATRLKDEFLANMSHELRTPLNAILGMSEVLRMEVYGTLNDEQLNALLHIEEGGQHLLELINDILDLSKIEAGKVGLMIDTVYVENVCQASLRFIKQIANKKEIETSFSMDQHATTMQADERRLKQILVNLLNNAVKFTPDSGRVGLEVKHDIAGRKIHFIVWDTGIGIAEEEMDRLFQPFVQIDSSLSRHHEGTGLGLSLVTRLAEMHGGSVTVESQVGQGSRFTVMMPWQPEESEKTEGPASLGEMDVEGVSPHPPALLPVSTILLVEDNEANIATLLTYLEGQNYRVIVARNGFEAVAQAQAEKPDAILMDIQMPEMDGLEATRRIRSDHTPDVANTPIIALTALAMPGDKERCLTAGASAYLSKPVNFKDLARVLKKQIYS